MNLVDALIAQDRAGIAIVADAASASVSELVARGMDRDRAEQLSLAAEVFYGSVRNTKAQAACVAAARENQHRLDTVSYTHLTLPTNSVWCRSRWSPYH